MPFTIRSLFQPGTNEGESAGAAGVLAKDLRHGGQQPSGVLPMPMSSPFGMEVPPASPFGGSLFKTREPEPAGLPTQPTPSSGSPFTPSGIGQSMGLTVADVLPQLPPDLARANSLPPDHPIAIAPELIEAALSNGHAAIPIFEVYRVCPAIFQLPVSPQDPRLIPLPPGKLPSLIAASQGGGFGPSPIIQQSPPPTQSPFTHAPADAQGSPFQQGSPLTTRAPAVLPPRRDSGMPPPLPVSPAPIGGGSPPPTFEQQSPSPFGQLSPFTSQVAASPTPSPFSFPQAQPAALPQGTGFESQPFRTAEPLPPSASPSLFASADEVRNSTPDSAGSALMLNSMFGASEPAVQPTAPSPFAMHPTAQPAAPTAAAPSPFGSSPFGQAVPPPFALTEPEPAPSAPPVFAFQEVPAPQPNASASPSSPTTGAPLKLSLATLLKGYSSSDLGFDPAMVPSWIMTSVPAVAIQNQMAAGRVEVELGMLIDGTTDIGFRNVLSSARRDLLIRLPTNELFHSLPAATATEFSTAQQTVSPVFEAQTVAPPPPTQQPTPPIAQIVASQPLNPFAAAKAALSGPLAPSASLSSASGPIQPKANANFGFAVSPPAPAPSTLIPSPQPKAVTSFDPFAAPAPQSWGGANPSALFPQAQSSEGFNSEQLFGAPTPPLPQVQTPSFFAAPESSPRSEVTVEPVPTSFTALPGIPPPPAYQSGSSIPPNAALQSAPPAPPFLPPPILNPFSGPLRSSHPPFQAPAQSEARSTPEVAMPFATPAPFPEPSRTRAASPPPAQPPEFSVPSPQPDSPPASLLGITPVPMGDAEQVMLRALLGVSEPLTVSRVVDLISRIPGVAACSCVNGTSAVSHGGSSQTAMDFQKQAGDVARNIRALAPLIGIADAETFSINTNERLMTFSFHPPIALGVLHQDNDLAVGLRDKITLVGRELSRMVTKTGGHLS